MWSDVVCEVRRTVHADVQGLNEICKTIEAGTRYDGGITCCEVLSFCGDPGNAGRRRNFVRIFGVEVWDDREPCAVVVAATCWSRGSDTLWIGCHPAIMLCSARTDVATISGSRNTNNCRSASLSSSGFLRMTREFLTLQLPNRAVASGAMSGVYRAL